MKRDREPSKRTIDYPTTAPAPVSRPALVHRWAELTLLHWPYDPALVQRLLPSDIAVDVFGGAAWVGLVPFHCTIRPPWSPRVPWVSSFEEMNVRTYVRGPNGEPGVWFLTLDAARLGAVVLGRLTYGLNYFWSKLAFARVGDVVTYRCRRRWPRLAGAQGQVAVEVGRVMDDDDITPLELFFTGRWTFYGRLCGRTYRGRISHEAWQLDRANVLYCDGSLISASGLPAPTGEPVAHHAQPVDVRMTGPQFLTPRPSVAPDEPLALRARLTPVAGASNSNQQPCS